ncbi:MAG: redoxin domain-containing protein, partial [Candidatus Lokiarchaeota archaeon]|nr:redoxin domain-containing protein [Candidatus Lokiarchaeota archaeon]
MVKNNIKVGDKAPLFKLESYNAGTIDLGELIGGQQKIVLIFSRYFGCTICQLDFQTLLEGVPEIKEKGA